MTWEAALDSYVRQLAALMGLHDWRLTVIVTEEPTEDALHYADDDRLTTEASSQPIPGQQRARLEFADNLRDEEPDYLRGVVVHELVHCHFGHLREIPRSGLDNHLGQQSYTIFMHSFDLEWERTIDAISHSWAASLPLIEWP